MVTETGLSELQCSFRDIGRNLALVRGIDSIDALRVYTVDIIANGTVSNNIYMYVYTIYVRDKQFASLEQLRCSAAIAIVKP